MTEEHAPPDDERTPSTDLSAAGAMLLLPQAAEPQDQLWPQQWHLRAIDVLDVWDDYTGFGTRVAVIDDGIDGANPDLSRNFDAGSSFDLETGRAGGQPLALTDSHGTAVAGLIGAEANNGFAGAGVAYDTKLVSLRLPQGEVAETTVAQAFVRGLTADVINNSWGGIGQTRALFSNDFRNDSDYGPPQVALEALVGQGRGGLGTVVVFSAGNEARIRDDVNYDNYTNSRHVISVAASDKNGNITNYSNPGAALLVTAPGGNNDIPTTDLTAGVGGTGSKGYTTSFGGTSASAPIVSGVAALMLQANPKLGYRDVQEILAYSARKSGGAAGWSDNGADDWNGGGLHVSHAFGFGLVDARAAVRLAESWEGGATFAKEAMVANRVTFDSPRAIPDQGVARASLTMPELRVEHVEVEVDFEHPFVNEVTVSLISPSETRSVLIDRPPAGIKESPIGSPATGTAAWDGAYRLGSTLHWGESGAGDWTLEIEDHAPTSVGEIGSFELRLYGDQPSDDDTYVYTDEYARNAGDGGRRTLEDSAGTDTLNAAAVRADVTIDLEPGKGQTEIAGKWVRIGGGTVIERAHGGDGDDTIRGNDADNRLFGWRGDDTIEGGKGKDQLFGFRGKDHLQGGRGEDVLSGGQGPDELFGGARRDVLKGGSGDDQLDGGIGPDEMRGGFRKDTYLVDDPGDLVIEKADQGRDQVESFIDYTLPDHVEDLTLEGREALEGTGNELGNLITGNAFANVLSGEGGVDQLHGLGGPDRLFGGGEGDTLEGGPGRDRLFGNAGGDTLVGNRGADVLDGGSGGDEMAGGANDDTYHVDDPGDRVIETADAGQDLVRSGITYTLPDHVENLTLTLSLNGEPDGTGNALANVITGNSDANRLEGKGEKDHLLGMGGGDHLFGGAGEDHLEGGGGPDRLEGGDHDDHLEGGRNGDVLIGGEGNDRLFGDAHDDDLRGEAGDDFLEGGFGEDSFRGGEGIDTISYAFEIADLRIDIAAGTTAQFGLVHETFKGIESARGGGGQDLIIGDDGPNVLEGGPNRDTLVGSDPDGRFPPPAGGGGSGDGGSGGGSGSGGGGSGGGGADGGGSGGGEVEIDIGDGDIELVPEAAPVTGNGTLVAGLGGANGFGEQFLARNDDLSSPAVDIMSVFPDGLDFFGTSYTSLYVNNNGNITFAAPQRDFTPSVITGDTGNPIIAPYFADVDTRNGQDVGRTAGGASQGSNLTHWDLDPAGGVLSVTWDDVGYYSSHNDKLNALQLQLYDRGGGDFDVVFRYESVNWTTGSASGGTDGFGGTVARAGWSSGNGADFFELPQAGDQGAMLALEATQGNTGVRGLWVFEVRGGVIENDLDADVLRGGGGRDTLIGSPGRDRMVGGAGQDRFDYAVRAEAGDTIADFELGRAGDVLDLVDLVSFDPTNDAPADFVRLIGNGADTSVEVDPDGGANGFRPFLTLAGVTAENVDQLLADGNLLLA